VIREGIGMPHLTLFVAFLVLSLLAMCVLM
jgi:hypothetical protein